MGLDGVYRAVLRYQCRGCEASRGEADLLVDGLPRLEGDCLQRICKQSPPLLHVPATLSWWGSAVNKVPL